ncbi:BA75_01753T0 [Komagataella pastoris]|uniref:ubiquitinyl hydrolase 1 n=1 Tax=Komagataella pastoris TaxID=4922 RepID=A0A1B2J6L1_PICPA|nr:BA75_01753T0 [Komagataella pastoris]
MSNQQERTLGPLVERILAQPVEFQPAKRPDSVAIKPTSYVSFGSVSAAPLTQTLKRGSSPDPKTGGDKSKNLKPKPKSMAEAIAAYTQKKLLPKVLSTTENPPLDDDLGEDLQDLNHKSSKSPSADSDAHQEADFKASKEEQEEQEEEKEDDDDEGSDDDDEEEDSDYHTAESSDGLQSEDSGSDAEADLDHDVPSATSDPDSDKEDNGSTNSNSSSATAYLSEVESLKRDSALKQATPPTSPENEEEIEAKRKVFATEADFYQLNELYDDRGSNNSTRIYKNWREMSKSRPLGLLNHGVTCYMNSAVQALIHIPAFQHYLNDVCCNKYQSVIAPNSVTKTLAETSAKMWQLERSPGRNTPLHINPKKLIRRLEEINCMMSKWQQEDSHEYLMSLMSRLQEDSTPKGVKLRESIIHDIFGGSLHQKVTCKNCNHISETQQDFYDLSLSLDNRKRKSASETDHVRTANTEANSNSTNEAGNSNTGGSVQHDVQQSSGSRYSIERSIKDFFSSELIKTDKKDKTGYVCEKCNKRTNAVKVSTIDVAPESLIIHLKRFRYDGNSNSSTKVKTGVSYPETLEMTEYTTTNFPARYKLLSVILHEGRSVSSGHYICYSRQPDNTWASYDDEYVNTMPEKQALKDPSAYVLVYQRITHKSISDSSRATSVKRSKSSSPHSKRAKR